MEEAAPGEARELYGAARLAQHARELAQRQELVASAKRTARGGGHAPLLAKVAELENELADVREVLLEASARGIDVPPAGAWLLDAYFLIVEHGREIRANMPQGYYQRLPKLAAGSYRGFPRIYEIALELIAHTEAQLDGENIESMIREYQSVEPLTLGELWAWPVMLRIALLESVRRVALRTKRDVMDAMRADEQVQRFRALAADDVALRRELAAFVEHPPELTAAFLTRFFQQLRSASADFTPLLWVEQWIAEDAMSVDEAVHRSTRRQSLSQLVMSNGITSLRTVAGFDWPDFVEAMSFTDAVLREDPSGCYSAMTFESRDHYRHEVEKLAKQVKMPEPSVARAAIVLAQAGDSPEGAERRERSTHVGYYLVGRGRDALEHALGLPPSLGRRIARVAKRYAAQLYFGTLAAATIAVLAAVLAPLPHTASWAMRALAILLALVPASEIGIALVNQLTTMLVPPSRLPRMDFAKNGVAATCRTIVVVPLLLDSPDAAQDALGRLETQFLANRDDEIRFALLSDFPDAPSESMPTDAAIVDAAIAGVRALNGEYADASPFYLFQRPRRRNDREGVWMGWERKRGKLEEFNAYIAGRERNAFSHVEGDTKWLAEARYVITLDADTLLPRGAAASLIGTIAHPLNRAVFRESGTRVVDGYGILQPRVSVTLESANRSRFASIFADHPGVDPYTTAVSDVYQDLFGEGSYTGKGIYDIAAFERATSGRFPENSLLSHDLIEGSCARAGLVTDVEIFDEYPSRYLTAVARQQRWTRGDWQLLPFIFSRETKGDAYSALSRWKMLDNLRRSLVPLAMLAWLLAGWTVLPGSPATWTMVALMVFALRWMLGPLLALFRPPRRQSWGPYYAALGRDADAAAEQAGLLAMFLPHQAVIAADAIVRALVRTFFTHRRMLEWTTSSDAERQARSLGPSTWRSMAPAVVIGLAIAALGATESSVYLVLPFAICWAVAPFLALRISTPTVSSKLALNDAQRATVLRYGERHWHYFDHFVSESTRWLVPDNFQDSPSPEVADRTSPTNIGLQLLSIVSAFDLGFLKRPDMIERLERALDTMASMRRFRGHFYNWYRLSDLGVLDPPYISTVDSGNLAGHLIAMGAACCEIVEGAHDQPGDAARLEAIAERARAMALEMDFTLLFDETRGLFSIGFDERANRLDASAYDLMASEARLTSFLAIAKGDAPRDHWFRLGRSLTSHAGATALVSWSGSMFEYLMPVLVMPSTPNSLLDQTHRAAVTRQIAYGRAQHVPWGISESAYNVRDRHDTYQYRGFGVPDLALKRGLATELVVAPYATALALCIDPREALLNLTRLEREGALGDYGFHDAIDYTRPDPGANRSIVRALMAHHVGMSLVAMDNALHVVHGEGIWQRRFIADPLCRAARLLLDERVPRRYIVRESQPDAPETPSANVPREQPVVREFDSAHTAEPRVGLLGDLPYCVLVTNAGSGYSRSNGIAVTRWRADATRDDTGQWIYVKDLGTRRAWSAAHQPTGVAPDSYRVTFATDRVVFRRRDGQIETRTDIIVVPRDRAEVRVVSVTNRSRQTREIELTSYGEVVLADPDADRAHPAFQNLFVSTEYLPEGIVLATRRPRSSSERPLSCAHVVATGPECTGVATCETDRAQFIGRGRTVRAPRALDDGASLSGSVGAVLDPIMSLRVRLRLGPGQTGRVAFTTLVADTRDEARDVADRYRDLRATDRALSLSWTSAQVELRGLDVPAADAALYQVLAGALLYPNEQARASAQARAENRRGQRTLWGQGISGDWPVVLATISDTVGLPSVRQLLIAHKYWRTKGVTADLVIVNDKDPSYVQDLHDQILSMVRASSESGLIDRPGGVFVRRADTTAPENMALLQAIARVTVICDGVGLGNIVDRAAFGASLAPVEEGGLLDRVRRDVRAWTEDVTPVKSDVPVVVPKPLLRSAPAGFPNGLGRMTDDGAYEMVVGGGRVPPAPWANIIANPNAGFCITERGGGFTWAENSFFFRLTPWHNDPVSDPPGDVQYLRDEESGFVWTPTPAPMPAVETPIAGGAQSPPYTVRHAAGRTTFVHERYDIASELSLGVPIADPVKIAILKLTNRGRTRRRISLTSYVELTLGEQREHTRHQLHTWREERLGAIFAQNYFTDDFASRVAFSWVSGPVEEFTADREEFIGRNGDLVSPAGLDRKAAGHVRSRLRSVRGAALDADDRARRDAGGRRSCSARRTGEDEARAIIARHAHGRGRASRRRRGDERLGRAAGDHLRAHAVAGVRRDAESMVALPGALLPHVGALGALSVERSVRLPRPAPGLHGVRVRGARDRARASPALRRAAVRGGRRAALVARARRARRAHAILGRPRVAAVRRRSLRQRHRRYRRVGRTCAVPRACAPLAPNEQEVVRPAARERDMATLYEHCVRALDRACTTGAHGLPLIGCGRLERRHESRRDRGKGRERVARLVSHCDARRFAEHAAAASGRGNGAIVAGSAPMRMPPPSSSPRGTAPGTVAPTSTTARRSARHAERRVPDRLDRAELVGALRRRRPASARSGDAIAARAARARRRATDHAAHAAVRHTAARSGLHQGIPARRSRERRAVHARRDSGRCSRQRASATATGPCNCSTCSIRSRTRRLRQRWPRYKVEPYVVCGRRLHRRGPRGPRRVDVVHRVRELDVSRGARRRAGVHEARERSSHRAVRAIIVARLLDGVQARLEHLRDRDSQSGCCHDGRRARGGRWPRDGGSRRATRGRWEAPRRSHHHGRAGDCASAARARTAAGSRHLGRLT